MRLNIASLLARLPADFETGPDVDYLRRVGCATSMDVVHLIYRANDVQGATKDFEFSRATMEARWQQGLSDGSAALAASPWLAPAPAGVAVRTFDVGHEKSAVAAPPVSRAGR